MTEYSYEEKLQSVLEAIKADSYILGINELQAHINNNKGGDLTDLVNDLIRRKYIIYNSGAKDGRNIIGYSITELGKSFLSDGGFVKEKEMKGLSDKLTEFNYDTRKLTIGISIISLIIASMFSLYTCINETSNKTEIELIKGEISKIKQDISNKKDTLN